MRRILIRAAVVAAIILGSATTAPAAAVDGCGQTNCGIEQCPEFPAQQCALAGCSAGGFCMVKTIIGDWGPGLTCWP